VKAAENVPRMYNLTEKKRITIAYVSQKRSKIKVEEFQTRTTIHKAGFGRIC
jgi:hypothetical protein